MTRRTELEPERALLRSRRIDDLIVVVGGRKVMLDAELAALYGVPTKALVQAVKRNVERFPADFMFQLSAEEAAILRSQTVTSSLRRGWGGRRSRPYAFTEQGVAMLSSVLRSPRAARVNVEIMRAFVRMRGLLASHADLLAKVNALEKKYDGQFRAVFDAIRALMEPARKTRRIGFHEHAPSEPPSIDGDGGPKRLPRTPQPPSLVGCGRCARPRGGAAARW